MSIQASMFHKIHKEDKGNIRYLARLSSYDT